MYNEYQDEDDTYNTFFDLMESENDMDENDGEFNENEHEDWYDDSVDDSMDGDTESALSSAGHGTDESYGYYGDDGVEDFHADEAVGFVDNNEDGPYND